MTRNKKVTILDYGLGNLMSVSRAIEKTGGKPIIIDDPNEIVKADYLVLPGVGNFSVAIQELVNRNFQEPLEAYSELNRPMLGICLGMQLLFDSSDEQGFHEGLGFISGSVKAIPTENSFGKKNKIPHIGWGNINIEDKNENNNIFKKDDNGKYYYFVHSYQGIPENKSNLLATTRYNDIKITAAVKKDLIIGCQFHPEKSGQNGIELINKFLSL